MAYGDGGFYFLQPVNNGYGGIESAPSDYGLTLRPSFAPSMVSEEEDDEFVSSLTFTPSVGLPRDILGGSSSGPIYALPGIGPKPIKPIKPLVLDPVFIPSGTPEEKPPLYFDPVFVPPLPPLPVKPKPLPAKPLPPLPGRPVVRPAPALPPLPRPQPYYPAPDVAPAPTPLDFPEIAPGVFNPEPAEPAVVLPDNFDPVPMPSYDPTSENLPPGLEEIYEEQGLLEGAGDDIPADENIISDGQPVKADSFYEKNKEMIMLAAGGLGAYALITLLRK